MSTSTDRVPDLDIVFVSASSLHKPFCETRPCYPELPCPCPAGTLSLTGGSGTSSLSLGSRISLLLHPCLSVAQMAAGTSLCVVTWKLSKGIDEALDINEANADCLHLVTTDVACRFQTPGQVDKAPHMTDFNHLT